MQMMKIKTLLAALLFSLALIPLAAPAQDHADRHASVNQHGDHVMGFSHETTTHHFRLYADGGAIEVQAHDPHDKAGRKQIQLHLAHIAPLFAAGDFNAPMLVHSQTPPGVPELQARKAEVSYVFAKTSRGGVIRITTRSAQALLAVHRFLRFQISDHQTGDSLELSAPGGKQLCRAALNPHRAPWLVVRHPHVCQAVNMAFRAHRGRRHFACFFAAGEHLHARSHRHITLQQMARHPEPHQELIHMAARPDPLHNSWPR